jgi:hypothetical protein
MVAEARLSTRRVLRLADACPPPPPTPRVQVSIIKKEAALDIGLHTLKEAGVQGVMVDVWWGICERAGGWGQAPRQRGPASSRLAPPSVRLLSLSAAVPAQL